jgi:hypothetical protein
LAYLSEDNVVDIWKKSDAYMQSFLDPVDEQERIANNLPHPGIDPSYPQVTDGTTSSIIKKTPRRIIQQLPTGKVVSERADDWLPIIASFIYTNRIIPNANEQYALIQKCWLMIQRALAHGAAHSYTPFVQRGDYFGTDLSTPYIKNVKFEAGKISDLDSNCEFLESWYQTADIERIIKQEKELAKRAKERGEKYESTWDIKTLEEIKESVSSKTEQEESKTAKKRDDTDKGGVKIVHALQRGVGAEFFSFHAQSGKIVRRKKNKDPRGEIPMQTLYFETDGINPLGRGIIDQVGSLQNLMDSEMQMYQYNRALMLNPPLLKRGMWNKSQAKFAPNVIIDMGVEPNNSLEALTIDTTAIAQFPQNYGLLKSQLLNLTSSPDTSISAEVGNPGFSKTTAGVNQVQQNVSVDDNYIRKQFETWFERWSETAINLYFAERTGKEQLQVDDATALALRKIDPTLVSEDNIVEIDYDDATAALKFQVDASTSNMKNDAQQLEALDGLLGRLEKSSVLQGVIPHEKIVGAWNSVVAASGVENPEELSVSDEEMKQIQEQQAAAAMAEQNMMSQAMTPPQPAVPTTEAMPQEQPEQAPQDMDDLAFITALQDLGYSDEKIQQALAMDQMGYPEEQIIEVLEATNG